MADKPEPSIKDYLFAWGTDAEPPIASMVEAAVGHGDVYPGRKPITDDPWPFTVENCAYAAYTQGYWTRDEELLFCPGCGLDGT